MPFKLRVKNAIPIERFGPVPANPAARLLADIHQPRHEQIEFSHKPFFEELLGQIVREEAILVASAPGSNKARSHVSLPLTPRRRGIARCSS